MKNDCMIISVESRKGGVGKTTAALNLAKILLEKRGYAVLFLDVDITGTNVAYGLDSSFWKNSCHPVKCIGKKDENANLLQIFEEQFMSGNGAPEFVNTFRKDIHRFEKYEETEKSALGFDPERINVIGSQIYNLDSSKNETGSTLICKPSILFDELHAFWFIEFLQETCEAFIRAIREEDEAIRKDEPDREVVIIIDNSPGYVGIAPAVQEWLTDLGPDRGKFLTISSLDIQDLLSSGRAIHNLHHLYERKWETSRKFVEATKAKKASGEELHLEPEEEGFFLRLVENCRPGEKSGGEPKEELRLTCSSLSFYCSDVSQTDQDYCEEPDMYQGWVINRVPIPIMDGLLDYDFSKVNLPMDNRLLKLILGKSRNDYFDRMVSYNEYIEYQYLEPRLSLPSRKRLPHELEFKNMLGNMMSHYAIPDDEPIRKLLYRKQSFPLGFLEEMISQKTRALFNEVQKYIGRADEMVTSAISLVEQYGLAHLLPFIRHDEWLPRSILRNLRIAMHNSLLETEFPQYEIAPWEFDRDEFGLMNMELIVMVGHHLKRMTGEKTKDYLDVRDMGEFLPSLMTVLMLSVSYRLSHWMEGISELFANLAVIEIEHWKRRRSGRKRGPSIQSFLANESMTEQEAKKLSDNLGKYLGPVDLVTLQRLYSACTSAQARLIDVRQDAEFMVFLIERLLKQNIKKGPVLPYIEGVTEEVIVHKNISHKDGRSRIAKGFSSAQYMKEFESVLKKILSRWGVNL